MFGLVRRVAGTVSDYTIGTAIVLAHLAWIGPRTSTSRGPLLLPPSARPAS